MKCVLKLEGLCCANCAAKIENEVGKMDGVSDVNVSFITQKLTMEADESRIDSIVDEATRIAKKVEGDVTVKRLK